MEVPALGLSISLLGPLARACHALEVPLVGSQDWDASKGRQGCRHAALAADPRTQPQQCRLNKAWCMQAASSHARDSCTAVHCSAAAS